MKNLPYTTILVHAWRMLLQKKYLIIFGFFIALGGFVKGNLPLGEGSFGEIVTLEKIQAIMQMHDILLFGSGTLIFFLIVCIIVLAVFGRVALIFAANEVARNGSPTFRETRHKARTFLWQALVVNIFVGLFVFCVTLLLFAPAGFLFSLQAHKSAIALLISGVIILIPLAITAAFVRNYAVFYVVLGNLRAVTALERGYRIFRAHIWESILFAILLFSISLGVLFGTLLILTIFAVPVVFLWMFVSVTSDTVGSIIAMSLAGSILLIFLLFISSFFEAFCGIAWTIFFRTIALADEKQEEGLSEKVMEKQIAPVPEILS